jgi:Bacterial transcriptional activator domain
MRRLWELAAPRRSAREIKRGESLATPPPSGAAFCDGSGGSRNNTWRTHKTAALFAYLAYYSSHAHPRDVLADLFWPDRLPDAGRQNLRLFQALRQLIEHQEVEGNLDGALTYAHQAVGADPLREEGYVALMRLHAARGEPGEAKRWYQRLERRLQEELDVAPSEETRALLTSLPARRAVVAPVARSAEKASAVTRRTRRARPRRRLPTGTVTLLLTDTEGLVESREASGEASPTGVGEATAAGLLRQEIQRHGGVETPGPAGSRNALFARAGDALECALACRRSWLAGTALPASSHDLGDLTAGDKLVSEPLWRAPVAKHISVYSNDPDHPQVELDLTAHMRPLFRFSPRTPSPLPIRKATPSARWSPSPPLPAPPPASPASPLPPPAPPPASSPWETKLGQELRKAYRARRALRLLGRLTARQRQALDQGAAVPLRGMTEEQQDLFLAAVEESDRQDQTRLGPVDAREGSFSLTVQPGVRLAVGTGGAAGGVSRGSEASATRLGAEVSGAVATDPAQVAVPEVGLVLRSDPTRAIRIPLTVAALPARGSLR